MCNLRIARRYSCLFGMSVFLLAGAWFGVAYAQQQPVGMVTGSPTGTYFKFGKDIAEMTSREGLLIEPKESRGSLDNIQRINDPQENAGFGIVQSDVLGYLMRDPQMRSVAARLRVIFPFYLEEVHILVRDDIHSLRDLDGKQVSVGEHGSGTWLTANNILKIKGVNVQQVNLKTEEAEVLVLEGKLDAVFYVSGKPVKAFEPLTQMANDPNDKVLVAKVHFLAVSPQSDPEIFKEYNQSSIRPQDYPWMTTEVPVAAVRAVLVAFDFSRLKTPYYRQRCDQLKTLGRVLGSRLHELQGGAHHPKWKEVTLDRSTPVPGWKFDECSEPDRTRPPVSAPSDTLNPIEKALLDKWFKRPSP